MKMRKITLDNGTTALVAGDEQEPGEAQALADEAERAIVAMIHALEGADISPIAAINATLNLWFQLVTQLGYNVPAMIDHLRDFHSAYIAHTADA